MSDNSLTSAFSLGVQSAKGTAATAYKTALAEDSGASVKFDVRAPKFEHPSPVTRATKVKIAEQRVGYMGNFDVKFLMRPRFIGTVLRGLGFAVATTGSSPAYTHTFTITTPALGAYLTAIVLDTDDAGGSFERKLIDSKINKLTVDASVDEIGCTASGMSLQEGDSLGSETKVAETPVEISPTSGAATITIGGATVASPLRGSSLEIDNTMDDKDRVLFSPLRNSLFQSDIGIMGTLKQIDFDYNSYEVWRRIVRGSAVATAPSITPASGTLTYNYVSLSNIPTGVVPYKFQITLPSVYWEISGEPKSSGNNKVRIDAKWTMIDDSSIPVTIVIVNDQSTYA